MTIKSRSILSIVLGVAVLAAVLAWIVAGLLNRSGDASAQLTQAVTPALIEKGAYLARAGDCVA
ncbi:cytochrome c, partial [Pseudomonas sp. NPDC008258]